MTATQTRPGAPALAPPPHGPGQARWRPGPWAALLTVAGSLAAVVAVLAGTVVLLLVATHRTTSGVSDSAAGVDRLEISLDDGTVRITGEDRDTVATRWAVSSYGEPARLVTGDEGATHTVGVACRGWGGADSCDADLDVRVPRDATVVITSRTGTLHAADVSGDLELRVGVGEITGVGLSATNVRATTGLGVVDLAFATVPDRVVAAADVGEAVLTLPDGSTAYDVDVTVGIGDSVVTVPTDTASAHRLTVHTSAGGVVVKRAGDVVDAVNDGPGPRR